MRTDVVVPAHNEAKLLGSVLEAIRAAPSVANLIVVCDRCSDGSLGIVSTYGSAIRVDDRTMALPGGLPDRSLMTAQTTLYWLTIALGPTSI
jgi:hypothetical protein